MKPNILITILIIMVLCRCTQHKVHDGNWDTSTLSPSWESFCYLPEQNMSVERVERLYGEPDFVGRLGHDDFVTPKGDTLKGLWETVFSRYDYARLRRYDWPLEDGRRLVMYYLITCYGLRPVGGYKFDPQIYNLSMDNYGTVYAVPYSRYWNGGYDVPWDVMTKNKYWTSLQYLPERNMPIDSIDVRYGSHKSGIFDVKDAPIYYSDQKFEGVYSLTYGRYPAEKIEVCYWRVDKTRWLTLYYVRHDYRRPIAGYMYDPLMLPE